MLGPLKRKVVNRNSVAVAGLREAPAGLAGVLRPRPRLSSILLDSWEERAGCRLSSCWWPLDGPDSTHGKWNFKE